MISEYNLRDYKDPNWSEHQKVHCWRNYVSSELQDMWQTFSDEQKIAIAKNAQEFADREDWD